MMTVIAVDGLTRRFGARRGLADVSFEVNAGEVFGFLGPNGAGKSTTIRLLLGLYRPTSGRMRVFDLDPAHAGVEIHRRVGYLPGELALYPRLTGRQHLDYVARVRGLIDHAYRDQLVERFQAELDRPVRTAANVLVDEVPGPVEHRLCRHLSIELGLRLHAVFLGELAAERPYGFGPTVLYSSSAEIGGAFLMFGPRGDLGYWGGVRQVFGAGVIGRGVLA